MNRRTFLKGMLSALAVAATGGVAVAGVSPSISGLTRPFPGPRVLLFETTPLTLMEKVHISPDPMPSHKFFFYGKFDLNHAPIFEPPRDARDPIAVESNTFAIYP